MSGQVEAFSGAFGPREIEIMSAAYWQLLDEMSEEGLPGIGGLHDIPARHLRRWLAGRLIEVAKAGIVTVEALKAAVLDSLAPPALSAAAG